MDISVVIVNHDTEGFLTGCLRSLANTIPPDLAFEVIVVDNGSKKNLPDDIALPAGNVTVLHCSENLGFSKANNRGVAISRGRYVLFLNPDTLVGAGTIEHMLRFIEHDPAVGAATCRVCLPDGRLDDASHRGFPTPWNALCHFSGLSSLFPHSRHLAGYSMGWANMLAEHEIDALAGAFMLVRRAAGEQVGWWDEDYFFYGEDLDFCYLLKQKGWKVCFVPDVETVHFKGVASGIRKESREISQANRNTRLLATRARFQAMRLFYRKHYVDTYPQLVTWLVFKAIDLKLWKALRSI